ncbi:MAG: hypothetical protein ACJLS3_11410 [Erythrobacter sp.]
MTKALSAIAALLAGAATCLAGGWIGAALVDWISAHRETVALTQPWLFPSILTLVALGMMKRRDGAGA